MASIYFFRGKAATGKTTITDRLGKIVNVVVLRKDDIFDILSEYFPDNNNNNNVTYDALAKLIQTNINNQVDIIVDVGLSNTNGYELFLSKLNLKGYTIFSFLCDCSNIDIWKSRFEQRLKNPSPNQFFKSVDEIVNYYGHSEIVLLNNEFYIDSVDNIEKTIEYICRLIKPITIL